MGFWRGFLLFAFGLVCVLPAWAGDAYELIELGTPGGEYGWANGINDRGEVVGAIWTGYEQAFAFLWTEKDGMIDLGRLDEKHKYVEAMAINNRGEIVGRSGRLGGVGNGRFHGQAFLWTQRDGMIRLGPEDDTLSEARDINERGHVVGCGLLPTHRALLWVQQHEVVELPGEYGCALGTNNRGEAVGYTRDDETWASLWTVRSGLTTVIQGRAFDINDRGDVVGTSRAGAFLWTAKGDYIDLGPGSAVALNNRGEIVGSDGIWTEGIGWTPLDSLGGRYGILDINERGEIAGTCADFWSDARPLLVEAPAASQAVDPTERDLGGAGATRHRQAYSTYPPT